MILVIDLGSQYTHVIWRAVRDLGFDVSIAQPADELEDYSQFSGFILSGGPGSAPSEKKGLAHDVISKTLEGKLCIPLLGICLGHQLIAHLAGGKVEKGASAEYGIMKIFVDEENGLFKNVPSEFDAWVSHYDEVKQLPKTFVSLAHSKECACEAMKHETKL
ncbi:gamma-glutamyl-gamma-aminobutyrate hydrolase family protein, partial [Candidatus Micrarchaeota archaeon]|nr:gamma-glutamyl-gamma-aminobutyrate hydrolase family protein [Candidatus Micrarchaeota archaeon]